VSITFFLVFSSIWVLTGMLGRNENELAWLSGVPGTVRTLSVAGNRCVLLSREGGTCHSRFCSLTSMTSYAHLLKLENLDISRNDIDSLRRECLLLLLEIDMLNARRVGVLEKAERAKSRREQGGESGGAGGDGEAREAERGGQLCAEGGPETGSVVRCFFCCV
jgi:hypothetical protein